MSDSVRQPSAVVIEDDEHVRYLVEHMLRREGFTVTVLTDGREAAEFIASHATADVVITDMMLPYLDGLELAQLIRAHPKWRHVPIIMLSARSQDEDVVRALEAGANDYVCKPYSPRELLARIKLRVRETREALEG
jgi:DNA-binding response OmpR family regulator